MRSVTYTNLTPGSYVLEVKAVTNDGVASKNVASLEIVIHPPFWLSNWAKALYLLLAIVLIILCLRAVKRREYRKYIEQQKAEASRQQEELTQMKFRFFTNISHELRTPLTLILSPLEAMLREVKDAKQHGRLQIMYNNAERLLYLVNQLLDFRKSEQVGLKYLPVEGDVVSFTKNICDNFVGYSENKNVQLTFFSSRPHLPMLFDGDKYSKIILNLLSNAFKFTPDGGRVDVALSTDADNLVVKVADTGIGIADSEKQHVFEGFYQTDTSKSSGSGIGLSLVKEYVKLHNGTVDVVDNVGGGSVFIVTMPIRHKTEAAEPEAVAAPAVADSSNDVRQRVLVVDDNADLLSFLTSELSGVYHVDTAADGMQAIEHIEQSRPDIIISDVMMPEMDGIELCRRLKSNPKYSAIPLIILTAKHDEQAKVEGLTIGADDYITKPFNCDLLRLRIKKLLDLSGRGVQRSLIEPEPEHIKVTSLDEKLVEDAVKYVEKNMERPDLSVEELSRQLGMSRVHLYKRMRQVTGKTPIEFIRVMRLKRAAQLLRESQLNVSEIAYRVGFNNPKYFSNYFKQEFGVLPSVYQAQQSK
jgi:signal transduction histidine kinase/DNA-binding response OmpR family regulator